jgi:periplasmic protein TonB
MTTEFKRNLVWSAVIHGIFIVLLALSMAFSPPKPPAEPITFIDLAPQLGNPAAPAQPAAPANPPTTEPISTAQPDPVTTEPSEPTPPEPPQKLPDPPTPDKIPIAPPKVSPKPEPKKKEPEKVKQPQPKPPPKKIVTTKTPTPAQPKVKVSNTVVKRPKASAQVSSTAPTTQTPAWDEQGFKDRLAGKLKNPGGLVAMNGATGMGTSDKGQESEFGWYFNIIFQEMYGAWEQPVGLDPGLSTKMLIRIEKNGVISKVSLASSSGNKSLDASALAAANRVKKLPPLPQGLGTTFAEINVNFKIQKQ